MFSSMFKDSTGVEVCKHFDGHTRYCQIYVHESNKKKSPPFYHRHHHHHISYITVNFVITTMIKRKKKTYIDFDMFRGC